MSKHKEYNHRKGIQTLLIENGIEITRRELKEILKSCEECMKKDKKVGKNASLIKVDKPKDPVGIDLLIVNENLKVIVMIDYFTRIIFARCIASKEAIKILHFVDTVYQKFKFKKLICDNGKEFQNELLKRFAERNEIELDYGIPYYHASNGRVERANRTIRDALKKVNKPIRIALKDVVDKYNRTIHRGIGMAPIEAMKPENWKKVRDTRRDMVKNLIDLNQNKKYLI